MLGVLKTCLIVLIGFGFFNVIIGVFGLSTAIVSLIVAVLLALSIMRRNQSFLPGAPDDRD